MTPQLERELKFSGVDHEALRQRLESLEAELHGAQAFEDNWLFDRGGELAAKGSLLRLRRDRQGARITFKGPARYEGAVKIRTEEETEIGDAESFRRILEAMGWEAVRRYQKYREEWRLGSIVISLDRTPIGSFAEVEGDGCETVARRLGLDGEQVERRNYLELYEDYLKNHPDAPADMIFRDQTET